MERISTQIFTRMPIDHFHLINPKDLSEFEEWARWLEALLHNSCQVCFRDGVAFLVEQKQLVERLDGLKIEIYPKEHPPPHFHLKSPEMNASFTIEDCQLISGKVSTRNFNKITYWHSYSKSKLIDIWNATRSTECVVGKYIPS